jgi:hypothetical protein
MDWHTATGQIVYDPPRPRMKRRTEGWCVLNVFDKNGDIARYYRYWIFKKWGVELNPPSHGTHVSIIRGEFRPTHPLAHLWKCNDGDIIEFKYSHDMGFRKGFFFCEVQAPQLIEIRRQFGFPTDWPLHMTFGKLKDVDTAD